jgi:hypothetical protein
MQFLVNSNPANVFTQPAPSRDVPVPDLERPHGVQPFQWMPGQ